MEGQECVARGHGDGPCVVSRVCRVMPSKVVAENVGEWHEEAGVAGGGGRGWGYGLHTVVVDFPAEGAVREAACGPCNGSTNVEDTLIYFVFNFIVEYAILL